MYIRGMETKDVQQRIRRANLEALIKEFDNAEQFSKAIEYSSSLISKYRNGKKNINEDVARKWEAATGKPLFWMDRVHGIDEELMQETTKAVDNYIKEHGLKLPDDKRRRLYSLCYKLVAENGVDSSIIASLMDVAS